LVRKIAGAGKQCRRKGLGLATENGNAGGEKAWSGNAYPEWFNEGHESGWDFRLGIKAVGRHAIVQRMLLYGQHEFFLREGCARIGIGRT
jgi:hypothetical protein